MLTHFQIVVKGHQLEFASEAASEAQRPQRHGVMLVREAGVAFIPGPARRPSLPVLVGSVYPNLGPPLNLLGYLCLLDRLVQLGHFDIVADVLTCWRVDVAGVLAWLANVVGVGDDYFPHPLEKLLLIEGIVVAQPVILGRCFELWAEAVPEVVHTIAISWKEVLRVVVLRRHVIAFVLGAA